MNNILTLDFRPESPDYLQSIPIHAGIVPDMPNDCIESIQNKECRVGVFENEMPQTVITQAYNYQLDVIQLQGEESQTYIDNLKRTLIPDILPNVKIIKK